MRFLFYLTATTIATVRIEGRGIFPTKTITVSNRLTHISSCAIIEQDVPVCSDPIELNTRWSHARTPYPEDGFAASLAKIVDGGGGGAIRPGRAAWNWWLRKTATLTERNTATGWPPTEMIVTYLMKGCSPTKVPFNLSPCTDDGWPPPAGDQTARVRDSSTRVIYYVPPDQ
ncbi:uncharacterized protein LOC126842597 [Adelges cooleyi]|uniref:uncharacterized protein LOC126842597 n=1 Tax=Adelges cooleyi TaxID=133065 RepID=UPI00217F4D4B|nr:uncharacterized protein LOC126842597 [Adelges cooleyi]